MPDGIGVGKDLRAGGNEFVIREATSFPCAALHEYPVPRADERLRAGRHEGNAILVGLDLFRNAYAHIRFLILSVDVNPLRACRD
jgi:hypothetical protein